MRKVATLVGLTVFALAGSALAQDSSGRIFSGSRPEAAPAADPAAPASASDPAAAPVGDPAAVPAPEAAPAPVATGTSYVSRGLTQSAGNLQVTVPIVLNLSKEMVLKPVWVPLDLRYGITDQLEVYLGHAAPVGPIATPGGVCLGGEDRFCDKFYDNLHIGAQFSLLKDAALELAVIGALMVESLDPATLSVDLGVNFKYATGPVAIKAAPQVFIGATERDGAIPNKEYLYLPVQVAFQATPELAVFLDTGIAGPLDGFGDAWELPVGVGASFSVMPNLDVGAEFMLPMVATGMDPAPEAFDMRYLALFAQYRLK